MTLWFELKYALRLIAKKPGHSILCLLVIAMSVSLSLVVFSLVYNTSYKQLDFEGSDRWVYATYLDLETGFVNFADSLDRYTYQEMEQAVTSFEQFGAMQAFAQSRFTWEERTTVLNTMKISSNLLQASNITPILGRSFVPTDEEPSSQDTVLLSFDVWKNYFASDPNIVGQQTRLNETPFTIIGVMPESNPLPINFDLMTPFKFEALTGPDPQLSQVTPMGILSDNVSIEQANAEIQNIMTRLRNEHSDVYPSNSGATLRPIHTFFMETGSLLFSAMTVTALVILFLACLNIANLLLSRGLERDQEFAIRNAVGSSRLILIRQSLLESLIICVLGTAIGLIVANAALNSVNSMFDIVDQQIPTGLPTNWIFTIDRSVLLSSVIFTAAIWISSGFMPAWMSSKPNVDEVLKGGTKGTTDRKKFRFSKSLVGFEIFSSCFLLVVCGVLLLSIDSLLKTDYGFALDNRMVSELDFPQIGFEDPNSVQLFLEDLQLEAELDPNIEQVAATSALPFSGSRVPYTIEDVEPVEGVDYPRQFLVSVSNNFFQTVDVNILEGRSFDGGDTEDSLPVVIVDEEFAQNNWPNQSAIGKRIQVNPAQDGPFYTVVGVSSHTKQSFELFGLSSATSFYRPFSQRSIPTASLIVKTPLRDNDYLEAVQESISRIDANVAVHNSRPFDEHLSNSTAGVDLIGRIFLSVSALTVILAGTGIFAIISRSVLQRVRESGIRRALGSTNSAVIRMYLHQGLSYLAIGVVFGGGCALLASSAMTVMFSELMSYIPAVFTTVVLGMGILIGLASWFPSRRAVAMEPGEALHYE